MLNWIKGAFYGVASGDALDGITEFMSQARVQRQYGKATEIVGGGF